MSISLAARYYTAAALVAAAGAFFAAFTIPQLTDRPNVPTVQPAVAAPAEPGPSARESAPPAEVTAPVLASGARFRMPARPRPTVSRRSGPPEIARPAPSRTIRIHPRPSGPTASPSTPDPAATEQPEPTPEPSETP